MIGMYRTDTVTALRRVTITIATAIVATLVVAVAIVTMTGSAQAVPVPPGDLSAVALVPALPTTNTSDPVSSGRPKIQLSDDGYTVDETGYAQISQYMVQQMVTNATSDKVDNIKAVLATRSDPTPALAMYYNLVCSGCQWDHKPKLLDMFHLPDKAALFSDVPRTTERLYYDVWSNIHYGYVGMAAGFDEASLQQGHQINVVPGTGTTDQSDIRSVQTGIDLYKKYKPDQLTRQILDQTILSEVTSGSSPWNDGRHIKPRLAAAQTLPFATATQDGSVLNEPSTGYGSLAGVFHKDDVGTVYCTITGSADPHNSDTAWYKVRLAGNTGYVPAGDVTIADAAHQVSGCGDPVPVPVPGPVSGPH